MFLCTGIANAVLTFYIFMLVPEYLLRFIALLADAAQVTPGLLPSAWRIAQRAAAAGQAAGVRMKRIGRGLTVILWGAYFSRIEEGQAMVRSFRRGLFSRAGLAIGAPVGCRAGAGAAMPLQHAGDTPTALHLRAPGARQDTQHADASVRMGYSCWAQSVPFDIALPADKVAVYLKEISAPAGVRAAWSNLHSRGLPWKERYTKHARIELPAPGYAGSSAQPAAALQPIGMAMDVLLLGARQPLRAGDELRAQVLRDGRPLADFALEMRGDKSPLGIWQRTDAEGRVRFKLPLAGRWVLRGTDLRLSSAVPDTWESRFVILAFEVAPKDNAVAVRTATP